MPLSVQGHHGLIDGLHIGRYFAGIDDYLHHPREFLAQVVLRLFRLVTLHHPDAGGGGAAVGVVDPISHVCPETTAIR
jgi:hypothetical protein